MIENPNTPGKSFSRPFALTAGALAMVLTLGLVLWGLGSAFNTQTAWALDTSASVARAADVKRAKSTVFSPTSVLYAPDESADEQMPNIAALQEQVEDASAVYDDANRRILEIEKQIAKTSDQILAIRTQLPTARKLSNKAASEYYRLMTSSNMFLDMIFGANSLSDFFANIEYTQRVNQSFLSDIGKLGRLSAELEAAQALLEADKAAIEEERHRAEQAVRDAQNAREVAEETARRIAEETAAATAAAAAAANDGHTPEAALPVGPPGGGPGSANPGSPGQISDKQSFVNTWAPRIDAYLAGSPLGGYGYAFANAAWDYNVDPRWSPAIACLESSKGRYLFREHNAWGWGQVDWPDWESAIYAHIRGLSIGYGYTISEAAAQKYCPPNWEYWYSFVSDQMTLI
ncbi:MAG: hypothetical protein LBC35_05595 [Coriobacteriales bacterium]|jgi:peptidoglycan hydrolase CwlO-like protein|nr:hypothetical protein [Coriobacteriales bacterium]